MSKRSSVLKNNEKRFIISGLVPIISLFALIFAYPIFSAFYISLNDWKLLSDIHNFIGFSNYIDIFSDDIFQKSFVNTIYFTAIYLALTVTLGLGFAVFLNSLKKIYQTILEVILFLPVVTITVAAALIWRWMYVPSFGIINYLLSFFNIGPFKFLMSPDMVIPSIVIMTTWKWLGLNVIIFLAGIQSIPEQYYEAARIDGAGPLSMFRRITLPLLKPTLEYIFVTTVLASMQVFTEIFMLTSGGPGTSSRVIALHIYEVGFKFLRIGEASAVAFVLFAFILTLTVFQFRIFKREELY
jgi:multiple sugar transport system permease protein